MKTYLRTNHLFIRCFSLFLCLTLSTIPVLAQVIDFPKEYQLYPRNIVTNRAHVHISGMLKRSLGYPEIRLKQYRNNVLQRTTTIKFKHNEHGYGVYEFNNEIIAELASYSFSLVGVKNDKGKDKEILIASADNIVAGDAYIIQGQSNAAANARYTLTAENDADDPANSPYRNFVRVYGSASPTSSYTKAWFIGMGNSWPDVDGSLGQWGMRMASNIAGARKIPIAIFNGAALGAPISYFSRNDADHVDPNTNYGRLLNRIREAGLQRNIRGVIWYQGESDVLGSLSSIQLTTEQYKAAFKELVRDWKADYPGLSKFYIIQIRYGCGMSSADSCLKIQEAQRQLDKESNEIQTLSVANTIQLFDGDDINYCHYKFVNGYKNIGDWMSPLILRDLYRDNSFPASIESPEPQSAAFSAVSSPGIASQVSLTLKNQSSVFTINGDLSSLFRLDGGNYSISSVSLSGNNVLVNFTRVAGTTTNPVSISYRGHDNTAVPVLTNSNGLALINFEYIPINAGAGAVPAHASNPNSPSPTEELAWMNNTTLTGFSIYPNPVNQTMVINYPADKSGDVELRVIDLTGRELTMKKVSAISGQNQFRLNVSDLHQGLYILQIRKENIVVTRKFLVGPR
ncbi:T9SS type A sorting domain-containing protein [Flavihumibacter profundi]|uniref:T9SS type A sorting domain-containing protein n=1 Tax=Flavihumibacter profundi TaxID=2716883 RepID=UPI001CC693B9|nr:T9SS type A sorting domain-containing protein [Flavihumibacter profundi]MBZ5859356.1 T9SS type A sorting domain-containing protein [Flavihumibacter profundi]